MFRIPWAVALAAAAGGQIAAQEQPAHRWLLITESRYQFRLSGGDSGLGQGPHYLLAEAGALRRLSPTMALGVTLWGGRDFGAEATRLGLNLRARRWVGATSSLELSVGPAYTSRSVAQTRIGAVGVATRLDYNVSDLVQFGLRAERVREGTYCPPAYAAPDGTCQELIPYPCPTQCYRGVDRSEPVGVWRVYAGVGFGKTPGLVGYAIGAALGILAAIWEP